MRKGMIRMQPVLISLGRLKVHSWGFMLAMAVIIAIFGLRRMFKEEGYDPDSVVDLVLILVVSGFLGSRLAYIVLYQWQEFITNPWSVLSLTNGGIGGLVWYGTFLFAVPLFIWFVKRKGYQIWNVMDMLAPNLALGYALVRIGCFLAGCCYGEITNSVLGVVFPVVDSCSRYPTQLFSSGLNFILFIGLIYYYPRRKFSGQIFILYLMGYSIYRFIVEYFRESLINFGPLTMGQVVTAGLFFLALYLYYWRKKQCIDK